MGKKITKRSEDYSIWYNDIVKEAELAEHSAVKGCMVIKPYGFALWENIQTELNLRFKETGHQNAYFPLFVPKSFLSKEAAHVEGFAKECAVVTHYRLKSSADGKEVVVDPEAKLEEELIVRPTSETIIWNTYKNWIQSYRDLPLLINQWANIVRWEMRTRLFLRTTEFLWQEGHTAHASKQEAIDESKLILDLYADFAENFLAIPVHKGLKSINERFAGAIDTYCIEALMQDGKSLQAGTSHFLGQNFAKAFDVKFQTKEGKQELVWATSWGVSTRLIGGLIMTHSDDLGLVLPPSIAPIKVVIVPIYKSEDERVVVNDVAERIVNELKALKISAKYDQDDNKKPGWKFAEYELKGIPLRIGIGPKDVKNNSVELFRRDTLAKELVSADNIGEYISKLLPEIQQNIFNKALKFREDNTHYANTYDELKSLIDSNAGFIWANWDGTTETELKIKEETKATIRFIPLDEEKIEGKCIYSAKPAKHKVVFAKAY
ncbi:MAG: proline--tRNA ligase [Bacteroidetes bacterium]|nr:proline--tRNA ligase [Bacteroidota bacterium]MBL6962617.1 proline--tRNA ligase [Bacteroidota bacterium]